MEISESRQHRWLNLADIVDGVRLGVSSIEPAELRELGKRSKLVKREDGILRRTGAFFVREIIPK